MELIDIQTAAQLTELSESQLERWIEEKKIATHITKIDDQIKTFIFKYSLIQYYQKDLLNKLLICEELLSTTDSLKIKNTILKKRTKKNQKNAIKNRLYQEDSRGILSFLFIIAFIFILFQVFVSNWLF